MPTTRSIKTENSGLIIMSLDDDVTLKLIYGDRAIEVPERLLLETASEFFHERGLRRIRRKAAAVAPKPRKQRLTKPPVEQNGTVPEYDAPGIPA